MCIRDSINDNAQPKFEKMLRFPVEFWTPDKELEELFATDKSLYEKIYDTPCVIAVDREEQLRVTKIRIELILKKKDLFHFANTIEIKKADRNPEEDSHYITCLLYTSRCV